MYFTCSSSYKFDEKTIRDIFQIYGKIVLIRAMSIQNSAFVQFSSEAEANNAILNIHNDTHGIVVKCELGIIYIDLYHSLDL